MRPFADAIRHRVTGTAVAVRGHVILAIVTALTFSGALLNAASNVLAAEPAKPSGWDTAVKPPVAAAAKPLPSAPKSTLPEPKKETPVAPQTERAIASPQAAAAVTQPGPAQSMTFADWVLSCQPAAAKQLCALSQTVRDTKNRRIIQIVAKRNGPAAYLELNVPLGISIPYGVSLDLSETLKLQTHLADCDPAGCRSVIALDEKNLPQIKSAKSLAVTFQDSKSGKIITIRASPNGFDQGIAMVLAAS